MNKRINYNFIFYIYYILILGLTLSDILILNKISSSIYFGLASAFMGIMIQIFYVDYKKQKNEIIENLNNIPKIELLHEEEFYSHFKFIVKNARHNVDLTHLSKDSPLRDNKPEQVAYYSDIIDIVKNNTGVSFRRVERISRDKIEWIQKLLKDFDSINNFSLYCFVDDYSQGENEMSDLLSIQRVDDEHTFIVAILEHTSTSGARDIYFRDKAVTSIFREYYNGRLIKRSEQIINKGQVNQKKWNKLKSLIK